MEEDAAFVFREVEMDAVYSSKTLVTNYKTAHYHKLEVYNVGTSMFFHNKCFLVVTAIYM
jgi:hypothetical protein